MTRAIVPTEIPELPADTTGWIRSTKGHGGMFHAHALGLTACRKLIDRHFSEPVRDVADMKYWGICPRCFAKVPK